MPCCDTGRNIQKYKGAAASTLQDVTDNGNTTTGDIITTSGFFIGDGSKLTGISGASAAFTLQETTDRGNTTSNVVQFTNPFTSFTTSGNVIITGNVTASNFYGDGTTLDGVALSTDLESNVERIEVLETKTTAISYTNSTTTISSNLEINGNLSITGNTYIINSDTLVIEDRIIGIANNNTSHTLDVGIIMQHPDHNIAIVHHGYATESDPHEHVLTIGYTQNTVSDNHITDDTSNSITVEVLGNLIVQNNLTISEGSIYGPINGSNTITTSGVYGPIKGSNTITTSGVYGPIKGSNAITTSGVYGPIKGSNTINASTISTATGFYGPIKGSNAITTSGVYGPIKGSNTINASTISTATGFYGPIKGSNTITTSGVYGPIKGSNTITTSGVYGPIKGSNTINAGTISTATGFYGPIKGSNTITGTTLNVNTLISDDASAINRLNASNVTTGTLPVDHGGTNITSYQTGDILYASAPTTLSNLTPSTAGYFLQTNGTGNAPTWENVANIGSATPANLYTDDYITGGPWSGLTDANIRVLGNVSNLSNELVARDDKGDIFVSNVNAIRIYGDGTLLTGVALSTDLASNSTRIGTISTDLADNSTRISTVSTDLASNSTRIGTVSTDLASNSTRIGTVSTDLASNSTRIGTVSTDLADNSTRISTVSTDLASNSTRIGTVSTDLASNSTRITNLQNSTIISNSSGITNAFETGDLIYASSQNTLSNLSIGSLNQVLTVSGGIPTWVAPSNGGGGYWTQSGNDIYYDTGSVGISNTAPTHTLDIGSNVAIIDDGIDKLFIRGNVYSTSDIISLGTIHADVIRSRDIFVKNTTVVAERPTRQVRLN